MPAAGPVAYQYQLSFRAIELMFRGSLHESPSSSE